MLCLVIWIRIGEDKYGSLCTNAWIVDKIYYSSSIHLTKTRKHNYRCRLSLEYEKDISRWKFSIRFNPENSFIRSMYPEYCKGDWIGDFHFETSCKFLNAIMNSALLSQQYKINFEIFLQQRIWLLLLKDGTKYQFILIVKVMKNQAIKTLKLFK